LVNQQFRRDYWIRGARRLTPLEQAEALRRVEIMLASPRADLGFTVAGALGQREMTRSIYDPILDALGQHQTKTIGDLERALTGSGMRLGVLYEAVMVLIGKGDVVLVQDEEVQDQARVHTDKLNRLLIDKARSSGDIVYLASPVTGGGVAIT